jgi:hypothetical protein
MERFIKVHEMKGAVIDFSQPGERYEHFCGAEISIYYVNRWRKGGSLSKNREDSLKLNRYRKRSNILISDIFGKSAKENCIIFDHKLLMNLLSPEGGSI